MLSKKIIADYVQNGIVSETHDVYYCKETNTHITKLKVKKTREPGLTAEAKKAYIEEFERTGVSPEGYIIYYSEEIKDHVFKRLVHKKQKEAKETQNVSTKPTRSKPHKKTNTLKEMCVQMLN